MGILDRFFKDSSKRDMETNWKQLEHPEQLEEIKEMSKSKPVAIFKHSIRCGVSSMVKSQLEREWNLSPEEVTFYYLDLITYRPISNQIEKDFGVVHQSPQLILIKNGEVVYHDSHYSISVDQVKTLV
ncbi:MAG: bacillithiol system redox-active protein YtxJ [Saprospiraceae bacterium]|nr:bacillithiol system redox-active protein YtxJ [Saprospiraceae bacterium]